jgi:hypothetical protein
MDHILVPVYATASTTTKISNTSANNNEQKKSGKVKQVQE